MADDITLTEQLIEKMAETPEQAEAAKRVLGIEEAARRAAMEYAPEPPSPPPVGQGIDHVARTRAAIARYTAWVEAHPDNDSTPLLERLRVLRIAKNNLQRLEGGL